MKIIVELLTPSSLAWYQSVVTQHHYLKRPVDPRCSVEGFCVRSNDIPVGCLLFGRPEATRCSDWYGSVEDVIQGRCEVTRWQVLNLARVWLTPDVQRDGCLFSPYWLPGYTDRRGEFRSTLASTAVGMALDAVVVDYLVQRPPCFPEEPYELRYCLSYCDSSVHRGTLYQAAGFELYRTNGRGIQTWRKLLRPLASEENEQVLQASERSIRSRRYRERRQQEPNPMLPWEIAV